MSDQIKSGSTLSGSERRRRELNGSIELDCSPPPIKQYEQSQFSKDCQMLAQVEKIWVMYDVNNDGDLSFDEIRHYLDIIMKNSSYSEDDLRKVF